MFCMNKSWGSISSIISINTIISSEALLNESFEAVDIRDRMYSQDLAWSEGFTKRLSRRRIRPLHQPCSKSQLVFHSKFGGGISRSLLSHWFIFYSINMFLATNASDTF